MAQKVKTPKFYILDIVNNRNPHVKNEDYFKPLKHGISISSLKPIDFGITHKRSFSTTSFQLVHCDQQI